MKKFLLLITITIITSCGIKYNNHEQKISEAIPKNSDLIIKFHDIQKIKTKVQDFEWWKELQALPFLHNQLKTLSILDDQYQIGELFNAKTIYLSSIFVGEDKSDFLFLTSISESELKLNQLMQTIKSSDNNHQVYEGIMINNINTTIDNKNVDIFFATHNNILLFSFSKIMVQKSIRQLKTKTDILTLDPIKKLDQNLPKYSDLNILVKTKFLEKIIGQKNIFLNSDTWSSFDVELENNMLLLNGVTNRGNIKYLKESKYSDTKKTNIENILPRHINGFYKYQINNISDLNEIINTIIGGVHENIYHLSHNKWLPKEINIAYDDKDFADLTYFIFQIDDRKHVLNFLKRHTEYKSQVKHLEYDVLEFIGKDTEEADWINKIMQKWKNKYYVQIEDYIIFSHSIKKIKSLINNKIAHQTIGTSKAINTINEKLGDKSHTSFYLNFQNNNIQWKTIFNSIISKNIASKDYFFNSIILLDENQTFKNTTTWSTSLDYETYYKPQLVLNHYTKKLEILTQDVENNIYLINNNGKRLWRKSIGNSILGNVHQIDRYKNNKLQFLFNTKDSIYLIDRNGNHVKPFPIGSKQHMSVPLALFDYDNTRNYRILVPIGNTLKMYNCKGEIISGWEFINTDTDIQRTPEHYQFFNKDYIIISEKNGQMHLLNRKGQSRIEIPEKIMLSKNPINLLQGNSIHESLLITQTQTGEIIKIQFNTGKIDTLNINKSKHNDYYITNNQHTLVLKNKTLSFSSNDDQFEYNFNTKQLSQPIIFTHNQYSLIGVREKSENLIYLLNLQGELYNQPFFGTTEFNIGSLKNDNTLNLIVGSREGLIYNYQIN